MGWRRAFCTSVPRDSDADQHLFYHQHQHQLKEVQEEETPSPTPRSCPKLSLFGTGDGVGGSSSYPSTPMLKTTTEDNIKLHCNTSSTTKKAAGQVAVLPRSFTPPATRTSKSPRFLFRPAAASTNPSSPISPSRFAFFKASLGFSKNRCGICLQSVKRGGVPQVVFTAECCHTFHFPCIAAHITALHADHHQQNQPLPSTIIACPTCSVHWRQSPFLNALSNNNKHQQPQILIAQGGGSGHGRQRGSSSSKRYDDDEPLHHSSATKAAIAVFNPIPEAEEDTSVLHEEEEQQGTTSPAFRGFFVGANNGIPAPVTAYCDGRHDSFNFPSAGVKVELAPVAALVSTGMRHQNYVISLKVKAPPPSPRMDTAPLLDPSRRAPIDLVTVLDVGRNMTAAKLYMLKRAMRLLISSLGPADRLAVVAFSSSSAKRLVPLRRMSPRGRRSTLHIVDRLVVCGEQGTCVANALKKAMKILEDRHEHNPVATIMLLSDAHAQQTPSYAAPPPSATRFAHLEIPIHESGFRPEKQQIKNNASKRGDELEDVFTKCVRGLLSVVVQDLHLHLTLPSGELLSVYSSGGGERNLSPGVVEGSSVRLGDLYVEEESELLVELRVPAGSHSLQPVSISVKCSYRDPATQELVRCPATLLPIPPLVHSGGGERLRGLFVTVRALAESRRLAELNDVSTAVNLLRSARSLLLQHRSADEDQVRRVEAELADLQLRQSQRRRLIDQQQQQQAHPQTRLIMTAAEGAGGDALTPTSAWRAAERLAKVAIMRKSMNRVSDLHGFENARF